MKTSKEILADSEEIIPAGFDPDLITIKVEMDEDGSILSMPWKKNITNIDFDHESKELLFMVSEANEGVGIKLSILKDALKAHPAALDYSAVISKKDEVSIYSVRIDRPIIGVGRSENGMEYIIVVALNEPTD